MQNFTRCQQKTHVLQLFNDPDKTCNTNYSNDLFYKENINESQSGSVKSIISLSFIYLQNYDTIIILLGSKASLAMLCAAF